MARGGLVKKLNVVKSGRALRDLLLSYVDEATKEMGSTKFTNDEFAALAGLPTDKRYQVFGFVNEALKKKRAGESDLEAIYRWWSAKTAHLDRKAFHHTFSLQPQVAAELADSGLPVGDILFDMVARTYANFSAQFFGSDEIGFVVGLHREKEHPHAHVAVFPQTRSERRMNFSRLSKVRIEGREVRIDFQGYLQESFEKQVERYRQLIKEKDQQFFKNLVPERLLFANTISEGAKAADKVTPGRPMGDLIGEAADVLLADPDPVGKLVAQRVKGIDEQKAIRSMVTSDDGPSEVARVLQRNASALINEFRERVATMDHNDLDHTSLRATKVAARLLEVTAAYTGKLPIHLSNPVNTKAVRAKLIFGSATADEMKILLNRSRAELEMLHNPRPLDTLVNRDLAPSYTADTEPDDVSILVKSTVKEPRFPSEDILSMDIHLSPEAFTLEVTTRAALLENERVPVTTPTI